MDDINVKFANQQQSNRWQIKIATKLRFFFLRENHDLTSVEINRGYRHELPFDD